VIHNRQLEGGDRLSTAQNFVTGQTVDRVNKDGVFMKPTVLVVEDDDTLRFLVAEALSMLEMHVIECATADHALQILRESNSVSLVLTDIRMPGALDGLDLARLIWDHWPHLPVILTSGHTQLANERLPPQAAFMGKPWTLDQLYQAVSARLPMQACG
jgi:DNA-binding NtrC family response regulator